MKKIFNLLLKEEKIKFIILQLFWSLCSLFYSLNVFFYAAFLASLTDSKNINFEILKKFEFYLRNFSSDYYLVVSGFIIFLLSFFSNLFYFILLKKTTSFTYSISERIQTDILKNFLFQDFEIFIKEDFSKKTSLIMNDSNRVGSVINSLGNIGFYFANCFFVILILLYINFKVTFASFFILSIFYFIVSYFSQKKLFINSQIFSNINKLKTQIIINCFQGIREIKIYRFEHYQIDQFKKISKDLVISRRSTRLLSETPRIFIESIFFLFVFLLSVYSFYNPFFQSSILEFILVFVICLFRLIPSFQYFYSCLTNLKDAQDSLDKTINQAKKKIINCTSSSMSKKNLFRDIELRNIVFVHDKKKVLNNVNLKIISGDKIFISGKTGSGKSTLLDIISGLRKINSGNILLNNLSIKKSLHEELNISYVPQNSYFINQSIFENIALGQNIEKIDFKKIKKITDYLHFDDFLSKKNEDSINKNIGDFGNFLSGGQRQRVALARSLYFESHLLLLDEATSAIDLDTEKLIIKNLISNNVEKTIIFVSHNENLREFFEKIFVLKEGNLSSF